MAEPGLIAKLYDLESNELADISTGVMLERRCSVRENLPRGFTFTAPSNLEALTAIEADDDLPNLVEGARKLIVWEEDRDDTPIFHGRCFDCEWNGNGRPGSNLVTARFFDPMYELGSEGEDRAGRPIRDVTGNFIQPTFGDPKTGAELIYEWLVNSQQEGTESDPTPGEGPLPIYIDESNFSSTVNLAMDNFMSWPLLIGDGIKLLIATGVIDYFARPVDPSESLTPALDPYHMVDLSVGDTGSLSADVSGTVHFDYWTGSRNAREARLIGDFRTVCNKLYDYFGPPLRPPLVWGANLTPGSPGVDGLDAAIAASRALYGGQFMMIRFFDQLVRSATDPNNIALWIGEAGYRVAPRRLLFITPRSGSKALFRPFGRDFEAGDVVAINTGADFGVAMAADQRVLGYDATWTRNNVMRVSQLVTSADVDLGGS